MSKKVFTYIRVSSNLQTEKETEENQGFDPPCIRR
ncbi:hypothetical protein WKT22_02196 [Candidatus Lokiarchaeum ossiferum]